ncbi:MAG: VWA domain-containing protein [bacterium]
MKAIATKGIGWLILSLLLYLPGLAQEFKVIEIAVVLDASGSMEPRDYNLALQGFIRAFTEPSVVLPRDSTVAVSFIQFADRAQVEIPLTRITNNNIASLGVAFQNLRPRVELGTLTETGVGVATAAEELRMNGEAVNDTVKKIIYLVTDGLPCLNDSLPLNGAITEAASVVNGINVFNFGAEVVDDFFTGQGDPIAGVIVTSVENIVTQVISDVQGIGGAACVINFFSPPRDEVICSDVDSVRVMAALKGNQLGPGAVCTIRGVPAEFVGLDTIAAKIPLNFGTTTIPIVCTSADSTRSCIDVFRLERAFPLTCSATIISPETGTEVTEESVDISVTVTPAGGIGPYQVSVLVNGVAASGVNGVFTATVPLLPEENEIVATATVVDSCGVTTTCDDRIFIFKPPLMCSVEIFSPPEGTIVRDDSIDVTGAVTSIQHGKPPYSLSCSINGVTATVRDTTFKARVPLVPLAFGENFIIASCRIEDSGIEETVCADTRTIFKDERELFGVDGDNGTLIRVVVNALNPPVEILGHLTDGSKRIKEVESMTWDPQTRRVFLVSNEGRGPLYWLSPDQLRHPSPDGIPANFIGATRLVDIEDIAVHPVTGELFGVENRRNRLVRIDKTTGVATRLGKVGFKDVEGLAFSPDVDPVLCATDSRDGVLLTIDTATGRGSLVHPDNKLGFPQVESLTFAPDGRLFGFSDARGAGKFITIDRVTAVGTQFQTQGADSLDIEGLTFLKPDSLVTAAAGQVAPLIFQQAPTILPKHFALQQNYPNPFNPTTTIGFDIPERLAEGVRVRLEIYNILGQLVRTLINENKVPGRYVVTWDGKDEGGELVTSGIYFYNLHATGFQESKRLLLLK